MDARDTCGRGCLAGTAPHCGYRTFRWMERTKIPVDRCLAHEYCEEQSIIATRSESRVTITAELQGAFDNHTGNIKVNASWKIHPFFPAVVVK
jgi:hypothetical protein